MAIKRIITVEQYPSLNHQHPSFELIEKRAEEEDWQYQKVLDARAALRDQRGYLVLKATNVLDPELSQWLTKDEVDKLIDDGVTVNIVQPN